MNKLLALLMCLLLCTSIAAFAEDDPFGDDAPEFDFRDVMPTAASGESIEIEINGRNTSLSFDSSEKFSVISGGTVQASFYAYSDNSELLYELYMIFPETVETGSTVTPEYAIQHDPDCSVVMIISSNDVEQYYFAGQVDGAIYPSNSAYSITFDSVSLSNGQRTYTGRLSASLIDMDDTSNTPLVNFRIDNAPFSFTMPVGSAAAEPDFPEIPGDDADPFADFPTSPEPTEKAWRI